MKTVALVPIKLNSQRLPHKNTLPLGKHPLCWYIPHTLLQVKQIDEVYVYCSNAEVTKYLPDGVNFLKRDIRLDGDLIKGAEIYSEFIKTIDADYYVLSHTTSPLLKASSIENALDKVLSADYDSAFSAQRIQTFSWYEGKPINYNLDDIPRTQDMKPIYVETSGFYIFKKELFVEKNRRIGYKPFIQEVTDEEAIDIDERKDYELACKFLEIEDVNA